MLVAHLVILYLLFFCSAVICGNKTNWNGSIREGLVLAFVSIFLFILVTTEVLSIFNQLNFEFLIITYTISSISIGYFVLKNINYLQFKIKRPDVESIIYIGFISLIITIIGFTAIYFPPNNWDSMTYNLARVAHWIQHENVEYYPTHIDRQLFNPPLHEYAMAHVYLLSQGDRFVNTVQLFSFLHCILLVSLITKTLGLNFKTQLLSSLICATIPMAILQASNTKNDLTLAFFVTSSTFFWIRYFSQKDIIYLICTGLSIGCAIATKGTALIFLVPIFACISVPYLLKEKGKFVKPVLTLSISALVVAPLFLRNYYNYGHILGSNEAGRKYYSNGDLNIDNFLSNLIRNVGIHFASGNTLGSKINREIIKYAHNSVYWLHEKLNLDINNPETTWGGLGFIFEPNRNEDYTGNLIHASLLILFLLSCFWIFKRITSSNNIYVYYAVALFSSFLFFSFYLKWQPWHSRLHSTFFIMAAPILAGMLEQLNKRLIYLVSLVLFMGSFSYLLRNDTRPLLMENDGKFFEISRDNWMFSLKGWMPNQDTYELAAYCKENNLNKVGLILDSDGWDYPYWEILKRENTCLKIYHVNAQATTPIKVYNNFKTPPVQLVVSTVNPDNQNLMVEALNYIQVKRLNTMSLYVPQ